MHELSLAQGIVDICRRYAAQHAFERVSRVRVEIGALSHVEPEALSQGFAAARAGTLADGAELEIVQTEGVAFCVPCGADVVIDGLGSGCPSCGSHQLLVRSGEEMKVLDLEVA